MKKIFLHLVLAAMPLISLCQVNTRLTCATRTPATPLLFTQQQMQDAQRTIDYPYVMNIYVHIFANDDGSNPATNIPQLNIDLQRMADFFKPHNICFILLGIDYYNNTILNNSMDPGNSSHVASLNSVNHGNAIDIFVHKEFGINAGGYTYGIPGNFLSVVQNSNFNFEHEMGHALGLYHTFETAFGEECPDGSDCSGDGDLICDTPADFPGSQNNVAAGAPCVYTGSQTTNCATFPAVDIQTYYPSTNNIMSYWASCYARFTPLQGLRMRTAIANQAIINNCQAGYNTTLLSGNSDVIISGAWYASAKNEITIGSTGTGVVRILGGGPDKWVNAGTRIRLSPGTTVRPDVSTTKFIINTLCD